MVSKNNQYLKDTKQGTKVESYSIKKFKVGTASVVIGASIFFGAGAVSQAAEEVSNNTTADNTTNAGVKAEAAPKAEVKPVVETTKESVASAVAEKVGAEAPKTEATPKAEVAKEEAPKVATAKKEILKASIATLEEKLKSAQDADKAAVAAAKDALAAAKAVLANEAATQAEVDAQAQAVQALSQVVTEAKTQAFDKKLEEKKEAEQKAKEATATKEEKEVAAAKKELTQVASEAEVTNTLAKTELSKKDLKVEAKPAVQAAVVKNEEALKIAKELLGNDKATKEQIAKSLAELSNSIKAVYTELENAGAKRNGKFDVVLAEATTTALKDASTETGKKWLEDHGYSSLSDIKVKTKEDNLKEIKDLNDQIQWLDFADTNAWTGLNANNQLQIGSTYTKELIPGYIVTMKVKELKPFESTEIFKNRVAGTDLESSYQPDKENKFNPENGATGLGANPQNGYTHVNNAGLSTGTSKTTIAGTNPAGQPKNGQAAGVKFDVTATYNGKPVKPGIVMTSGEDIGPLESEIYTTNGTPWDLAAIVGYKTNKNAYVPLDQFKDMNGGKTAILKWQDEKFYNALSGGKFATPDASTAGLGSQVFGGYRNNGGAGTPVLSTANVTEVGLYIMSSGQQSSMIGIKFSDFGDLPESYGLAEHYLRTETVDYLTKQKKQIQQPYLGKVKADIDSAPGTHVRGIGSDDATETGDEGVDQLIAPENVHINKDTGRPEVQLVRGPDNTYKVKVRASANGNEKYTDTVAPAYVRGFIDFNGNGKFDKGEESNIATVTGNDQTVELTFTNTQVVDTTKDVVNFRVRIAKDESQVEKPNGIAYSGEVEDNQIQVIHPPRGDKEETTGKQGETQSVGIEFRTRPLGDDASDLGSNNGKTTFNSYGKIQYTEQSNVISAETTKKVQTEGVMIVNPDGTLTKTYTKAGQGTYTVTDDKVTFTPEANFVGKADGIVLRAVDSNGQSTGWTALTAQNQLENINDGTHTTTTKTMDAVYIPTVTPKEITADPETSTDVQGKEQKKTPTFKTEGDSATPVTPNAQYPAKLVDPKTGAKVDSVTVDGEGTYTINPTTGEVTFQPLPTFKGTATGVDVTLTAPVGQDKDGQPVTATATTKYTPTVTAVEPTAKPADSAGVQGETQKGTPTFTAGNAEVPIKENSVKLLNPDGTEANGPVDALDEKGNKVGEYTVNPATGEVTFTPTDKTYTGKVTPAKVQAEDKNGTKVNTTYTPHIVGVTPTATPAESSGIQGQPQDGTVSFAPGETTVEGVKKSVPIKANSAVLLDASGNPVAPGTPVDALDPEGNKVGEYTIDPATNKVTFTPTNKEYKGKVQPAKVQAEDENGTKVNTTYTPTIVGVTPTASPAETTDVQGVEQSKEVTFKPGKATVNGVEKEVPIDTTSYKLLDENGQPVESVPAKNPAGDVIGTYTLKVVDGKATAVFTPTDKTYAGEVEPVTIQAKDTNGTPVTTTYTPNITPVEPTGKPTTTEGAQGQPQEGTPTFTPGDAKVPMKIDAEQPAKLIDPATGQPTDETTIPAKDANGKEVGTYTIDPTTGKVTFTPNKDFTGTPVPATVQAKDANGTPTTATYTPTVKPVTPKGVDTFTKDIQGAEQKGTPEFKPGKVTIDGKEVEVPIDTKEPAKLIDPKTGQPVDSVTIDGEGTYTVNPETGEVTFTPEKDFTGQAKGVTVKRVDKNGTPVTAKYTPVVLPVTPTSKDVTSIGEKGQPQSETPVFTAGTTKVNGKTVTVPIDETVAPTFEDGTTTKEVPGEGTYTIDATGKVTFTPEPNFVGEAKGVTVKRVDENGTPVTAKYTPTVLGKTTTENVVSEGAKGQTQSNTPVFKGDVDTTVAPTFADGTTEKKVPGEGTYTIDATGKVTFTPEPNFVGTATPVEVVRKDKNGKTIKASYTPTVRPDTKFVVVGKDGKETELLPSKDGKNPSETIPGYKLVKTETDEKGNTKHIYEPVTTKHVDRNGNPIPGTTTEEGTKDPKNIPGYKVVETKKLPNGDTEYVYEKVTTRYVDKAGHPIPGTEIEEGTKDPKNIPGYKLVSTTTTSKGDTVHTYAPVQTFFKDKDGNVIPGTETEEGTTPKKDIPGYKFVTTKKLPNGDTEYIYEKVTTVFKDKDGNVIPGTPTEEGTTPKKDIPGYRFVTTKTLPNGDTEHVYEKVNTVFKDKDGNVIPGTTTEVGEQPKKDIPGYKFVTTNKLPNGDIEHVYEKVTTPSVEKPKGLIRDTEGNVIPGFEYDMLSPVLDIPEYQYVETVTDPDGTVRHIYRAVQTIHRDKDGNPIPNVPTTEKGTKERRNIPGYRLVEGKKLPNGDTEYIYEKVKATTTWTDENGNPLKPSANGTVDAGSIEGYVFDRTVVDGEGNVHHIFKKSTRIPATNIVTTWTDENGNPLRPSENGAKGMGTVEGYEFVRTIVDENGNIRHIFRKVTAATPKAQVKRLANTGSETSNTAAAGFGVLLAGIAAAIRKRRKED